MESRGKKKNKTDFCGGKTNFLVPQVYLKALYAKLRETECI